jgi:Phage integrase family
MVYACRSSGVNPHAFRHVAATDMLQNRGGSRVNQTLLGHTSIVTTEIYHHFGTRSLKSAVPTRIRGHRPTWNPPCSKPTLGWAGFQLAVRIPSNFDQLPRFNHKLITTITGFRRVTVVMKPVIAVPPAFKFHESSPPDSWTRAKILKLKFFPCGEVTKSLSGKWGPGYVRLLHLLIHSLHSATPLARVHRIGTR